MRVASGIFAVVASGLALLVGPPGAAAQEGVSAASASLGVGTFTLPGEEEDESIGPTAGGVAALVYERGFSEALSWRVELAGGLYLGDGTSWTGAAAGGLVYRFDVLKYVPYGFVEAGAAVAGGGPVADSEVDAILQIGGGLDVLTSRSRSWGIEARLASFAGDLTMVSLSARYTVRWGFF